MTINLRSREIKKMDEIQDGLSYSVGDSKVSITELMTHEFIAQNTNFDSWESFLEAAAISDEKDFERTEFDEFIKRHTNFEEWEEMLVQASNRFAERKDAENQIVL